MELGEVHAHLVLSREIECNSHPLLRSHLLAPLLISHLLAPLLISHLLAKDVNYTNFLCLALNMHALF
jgi:hypothetical protein